MEFMPKYLKKGIKHKETSFLIIQWSRGKISKKPNLVFKTCTQNYCIHILIMNVFLNIKIENMC